jgi:subtilase family serine protease
MSSDETLDASDIFVGAFRHFGELVTDQSYIGSATVNLPVGVAGNYFFFVQTDSNDDVYENIFGPNSNGNETYENNNSNRDSNVTNIALTPPPDLEFESLFIPTNARSGRNLSINYKVTNFGATQTPNGDWTDTFYLSTDNQLDIATDIRLGDRNYYGGLYADASYDRTFDFALSNTLTGTYYVFGVTDSANSVFELNNDNNLFKSTNQVTIVSQPADLLVTSTVIPTIGKAGKTIQAQWTVKNQGIGDTIATTWRDLIFASVNNVLGDADDVVLADFNHEGLLNVNDSYSRTENVEIPFNLEGDYQVFVVTDVVTDLDNGVYEGTNESNNVSKALPISIFRQTPDLQVTTIGLPVTALSGTPIALSWTVTNLGLGRTNSNYWHDDVYLSLDTTIGSDDIKLGSIFRSQGLDAAESYTVSGNFNLPIDLNSNYYALVRTDRDNQVFEDVLENNNDKVSSRKIDISLGPVPDLVMQSVDADAQGIAGQPLTVTWTVVNNGTNTEEYFYDAIYLSRDQIFDRENDIYLGYRYHSGGLKANESYSETQSFKVPNGLAGRYYTFVVSDRLNTVYERNNKANNSNFDRLSTEITLPIPADLVVGTITIPTNNIPGQNAVISYTVTNQGTNAAIGTWEDSVYISKDKQWDVNDAFFGRVSQKGVNAGGSYSKTLIEALPGGVSGDYYVIVRSDIRNNLPETNETNNIGASLDAFTLNVEQLSLGVPDTGVLGKGQSVYYRIDVAAGETLQLSLDSQSTLAANELYIRYGDIPSRSQFDFGFTEAFSADQEIVVPTTQAGTYYVLAYGQTVADSQPTANSDQTRHKSSKLK